MSIDSLSEHLRNSCAFCPVSSICHDDFLNRCKQKLNELKSSNDVLPSTYQVFRDIKALYDRTDAINKHQDELTESVNKAVKRVNEIINSLNVSSMKRG